jgi:outer membrane protein OmpA-like peptidoglycan-associated protein
VVRLRGVSFGFDRAEVTDDSTVVLDVAAEHLRQCEDIAVRIDGHTDSVGDEAYNRTLSERRAEAVRKFLVGAGIGADRLTVRGLGESAPIAPNDTEEGRALNRRVELHPLD